MTDYRRPSQTNKQRMVGSTSRGLEGLLAILAATRGGYNTTRDYTSRGIEHGINGYNTASNFIAGIPAQFNSARNDLYGNIDQMSGLQGQADEILANQQSASNQAYARGQQLFQMPGRQAQYKMQQMGMPQGLLDLLNPGQPAYEALNGGQLAIDDLIAQVQAAGDSEKAKALLLLKQDMATKAMQIYQGAGQQVQQGYDAAREKAADLIQQLMGN